MRLSRLSILLLPLLLLLPAGVSGADPEAAYQSARADYHILKNSARKQLFRENWLQVIDGLVDFQKRYPSQRRAPDALYLAGKAAEGLYQVSRVADDARLAVSHFDRVAELYPGDNLADDALFLAGGLLETPLKEPAEAYQRYLSIVQGHPGGDMFAQAQVKLRDLAVYAPKARSESSGQAATGPARLEEIRFWTNEGYTRVVLDLDRPVEFSSNQLPAKPMDQVPPRIYLDLAGIDANLPVPQPVNIDDGVVRQIRAGRPAPDVMRVVLDLDASGEFRVFSLSQPFRLVIDIAAAPAAEAPARQPELRKPPGTGDRIGSILDRTPKETPLRVQIPERRGNGGLRRVVVDAGHGGKDPGAIGPSGVLEKDVALAIARELARRIEKELGCEVVMTRDRDVFIPLQERTALANKIDADLFISVHANASPNSSAYGIETY